MNREKLDEILRLHKFWLEGKEGGVRADLSNAGLSYVDLSGVDLSGAYLSKATIRNADLRGANLRCANLSGADLRGAKLNRAILSNADLRGTNISNAKGLKGIARLDFGGWSVCVHREITFIGCVTKESAWWLHRDALAWWKRYGEVVKAAIKATMEEDEYR